MTKSHHCRVRGCHESCKLLTSARVGTRVESVYCTKHACRTLVDYPDSVPCSRVAVLGTKYCDIHPSCTVTECDLQRHPNTPFCYDHTCTVRSCPNPASPSNHRCENHMPCPVQGCPNFLYNRPDGRGWYNACRDHVGKRCDFTGCHRTVGLTETYCADHICTVRGCREPKDSGSNCQHHTCAASGCPFQVAHPDLVRPNRRTCAFCTAHECRTLGCHAIATVVQGHCRVHGCRIDGCTKAKSPDESADGYCISHIKADVYRRAERAGRVAEFNDAIERREKQMDQQRELDKIQKEHEDRMRLEEENESLRLENQRLQAENASVADHYASEQRSHRYSIGSPGSGSAHFDYQRSNLSHHRRIGDHVYDAPANRGYDDGDSVISGSTDDYPAPPRRSHVRSYVRR